MSRSALVLGSLAVALGGVLLIAACGSFEGDAADAGDAAVLGSGDSNAADATVESDGAGLDAEADAPTDAGQEATASPCVGHSLHTFCHDFDNSDGGLLLNGPGFGSTNAWDAVIATGGGGPTYGVTRDAFVSSPYSFFASVKSNSVMLKRTFAPSSRISIAFDVLPEVDVTKTVTEQKLLSVTGGGHDVSLYLFVDGSEQNFACRLLDGDRAPFAPASANGWNHVELVIDSMGSSLTWTQPGKGATTRTRPGLGAPGTVLSVGLEAGNQQWKAFFDNVVVDIVPLEGGTDGG